MVGGSSDAADLQRIRDLARDLADSDQGPAGELACALAEEVVGIAGRVDALWRLITAVVESAGLLEAAGPGPAGTSTAPAEFLQAMTSPRSTGGRGLRLSINDSEWVAAVSHDQRPADPARAWAALERLTKDIDDQDGD